MLQCLGVGIALRCVALGRFDVHTLQDVRLGLRLVYIDAMVYKRDIYIYI